MLFVLNKEKICAYVVSVLTVVILFCVTNMIKDKPDNTISTSTNAVNNTISNTSNSTNNTISNSSNSTNNIISINSNNTVSNTNITNTSE